MPSKENRTKTLSYDASCVLTGNTPIIIKLEEIANIYNTTKTFPTDLEGEEVKSRKRAVINGENNNLTVILSGYRKLNSYYKRFKVKEGRKCKCGPESQTIDHLVEECKLLEVESNDLRRGLRPRPRNWPIPRTDLIQLYTRHFIKFVDAIKFETIV
ncbi:hypothetical protein QE152_g37400 [Popillia japonica]|uniref:Uncharacterized protein n=1 Tax=Popillia japonica TaxID=7064 RepID=A0AAW1IAE9_POPJA